MLDYSELIILLDRSGSMQDAKSDHEGGLNSFIEDQRLLKGDTYLTLVQFDSHNSCEIVYDGVLIEKVGKIELIPRGGTPLLEAIVRTTVHVKERLSRQSRKPDQVVLMIITDGHENSSAAEYTKKRVQDLLKECTEKNQWVVLYLGANVDAFDEAHNLGINLQNAVSYNNNISTAVHAMYAATSSNTVKARRVIQSGLAGQAVADSYTWTDEQRHAMNTTETSTTADTTETKTNE